MRAGWLLLVLVMVSSAAAKPLPPGLEVKLVKGKVMAKRGTTSVAITSAAKVISVELSDDGKNVVVKIPGNVDMGEDPEVTETLSLASIEARIANATGMGFQVKKKYADAVAPFTAAVQQDPEPVYVTNLLSALSMGKQLDAADKVIAAYGKRIAPWLAWRLAVDKELAALVGRPSVKALFPGGGTATSRLNDDEKVAYSPAGYAAVEVYTGLAMGDMPTESSRAIAFVDLASGTEVLRLATDTTCTQGAEGGCKQKRYEASNKKQRKVADAILAQLGFEVGGTIEEFSGAPYPRASDGRTFLDREGSTVVVAGRTEIRMPDLEIRQIAFVPKAVVLVHRVGDGQAWEMKLTSVPTP